MKSPMLLLQEVLNELGTRCCTSTTRDVKYVAGRMEREGEEFLTISLPGFAKDFERSLDQGYIDESSFRGFKRLKLQKSEYLSVQDMKRWAETSEVKASEYLPWHEMGPVPLFLKGFMSDIFHPIYGYLLCEAYCGREFTPDMKARQVDSIQAIRQVTLMFAKIDEPCSDARIAKAMTQFVQTDQEVAALDRERSHVDHMDFSRVSNLLFGDIFARIDKAVYEGNVIPKHGPGATADRLKGNQKFDQVEWPRRLDRVFPAGEYLLPNWRYYQHLDRVTILEPEDERPVRVISVPKTASKPRIIAIEPTAMQYMQQAIKAELYGAIERDELLSAFIGFEDQMPNQQLALVGSLSGDLATLDLSEASDRVSISHVADLMARSSNLLEAVMAVRSTKADVEGYGVIPLAKYASMGSALTFPLEAMCFLTSIFLGIEQGLGSRLTRRTIKSFVGKVRVYGDDIIVPVDFVHQVVASLEGRYGFKVNHNKSFWTGKFRESCGKEYYDGMDVSIVRMRRKFPTNLADASEVISAVSLRNQFYWSGMWETAKWIDDEVLIPLLGEDRYPYVLPTSPVLGRHAGLGYENPPVRMSSSLHCPLVQGYVVRSVIPVNTLDDTGALLKWFLKRGDEPFADEDHLKRSGRPVAVSIKLQWAPPF